MIRNLSLLILACMAAGPSMAGPSHQLGRINNITVAADDVLIKLDSGLPDNCAGTNFGWMLIPSTSKALKALVLALWARGDMSSTSVTAYTDALVGSYCHINQIDPVE
jgi:hypothetical protein